MQQDMIILEKENSELRKQDKVLRKEYLLRYKELEKVNNDAIRKKNQVIEE